MKCSQRIPINPLKTQRNPQVFLSVLACAFAVEVQQLPADISELYADLLDQRWEKHRCHVVKKSSDFSWNLDSKLGCVIVQFIGTIAWNILEEWTHRNNSCYRDTPCRRICLGNGHVGNSSTAASRGLAAARTEAREMELRHDWRMAQFEFTNVHDSSCTLGGQILCLFANPKIMIQVSENRILGENLSPPVFNHRNGTFPIIWLQPPSTSIPFAGIPHCHVGLAKHQSNHEDLNQHNAGIWSNTTTLTPYDPLRMLCI